MRDYEKYYNLIAKHIDVDITKFELYKKAIDEILDERADEIVRALETKSKDYKDYYNNYKVDNNEYRQVRSTYRRG